MASGSTRPGDPGFHWSEINSAEELVDDEITEDEVFEHQDPFDRFLDSNGKQAVNEIFRRRYSSASSRFKRLTTAKDKTNARYRALNLLTVWLGMEVDTSEHRIQAQKIAIRLFQHVKQRQGDRDAVKSKGRVGIVKELVANKCEGDSCLQNTVMKELYVFLIVSTFPSHAMQRMYCCRYGRALMLVMSVGGAIRVSGR